MTDRPIDQQIDMRGHMEITLPIVDKLISKRNIKVQLL